MFDILEKIENKTIKCLDKGFVKIIDCMPRLIPDEQTADYAIVQMARTSYGNGTKTISDDTNLINYLYRCQHTSPFEAVEFKFHIFMPIFCARQHFRHRTASANEASGRYSVMRDEFYFPKVTNVRSQSTSNKQSSEVSVEEELAEHFINTVKDHCNQTYSSYDKFLKYGVCREQARMMLPVNLYTEFYWKQDLHNLLHFLALRCDEHTQWETSQFANAMLKLIEPIVPITIRAWNMYHPLRNALKFTSLEVDSLKEYLKTNVKDSLKIKSENKREQKEWEAKLFRLGINVTS